MRQRWAALPTTLAVRAAACWPAHQDLAAGQGLGRQVSRFRDDMVPHQAVHQELVAGQSQVLRLDLQSGRQRCDGLFARRGGCDGRRAAKPVGAQGCVRGRKAGRGMPCGQARARSQCVGHDGTLLRCGASPPTTPQRRLPPARSKRRTHCVTGRKDGGACVGGVEVGPQPGDVRQLGEQAEVFF
jgi:hypothetical protein